MGEPQIRRRLGVMYPLLVGLPVTVVAVVLWTGPRLAAPAAVTAADHAVALATPASAGVMASTLMVQLALILLAASIVRALFHQLRQPLVVGEMVAGILLGPSLLGWIAPGAFAFVFPAGGAGALHALGQLGVLLLMLLVGLSVDTRQLKAHSHAAVLTSHVSIVVPFALASLLAVALYPRFAGEGATFVAFSLFVGAAMSVTAFPVLARILKEYGLLESRVGTLALASAAVDDVTGWCILAYVLALVRAGQAGGRLVTTVIGCGLFVALMIGVVRPAVAGLLGYMARRARSDEEHALVLILLALCSALATEWLGLHLVFGAFVAGAIVPRDSARVQRVAARLELLTVVLLLPIYFALTGLRTTVGLLAGAGTWAYCAVIVLAAIAGKLGGCVTAMRCSGSDWRTAAAVGTLMNTRGLMELVILNIGLDSGVISSSLFTMMVLMAVATTMMTGPLLQMIYPASSARCLVLPDELRARMQRA